MHFNTTQKGRIPPLVVDYLIRDGEFAPSVVPKSELLGRRKGFRLDPEIRISVLSEFGLDRSKISIDLFASVADAHEQFFCTEQNSAWQYDWSKFCSNGEILWANPPFEDMSKVLTKICLEPCRIVLVVPQWKNLYWSELLSKIQTKKM